jgi:hypothetical protein
MPDPLRLVPVSFDDACRFIAMWHRHHAPPRGHKFSIGVAHDGALCGVAMIGRPVARSHDDGLTLEVNRSATDGTPNANSMLYAAAWRAAKAMGFQRLITLAALPHIEAAVLRAAAERLARGPDIPLPPGVYIALLNEYADEAAARVAQEGAAV